MSVFTYQYMQPSEYRFSLDSIQLANFVAKHFSSNKDLSTLRVLDLCAGCGVIGIQLSWHLRDLRLFDFVEVQEVYTDYFQQNVAIVNRPELQMQWHTINYDELLKESWKNRFDLIISNPPYFQPNHGMLSASTFKNRCRFYIDSTFEKYILSLFNSMSINGKAYFLLRSLKQHGCDLFDDIQLLLKDKSIKMNIINQIRGTDVILMEKL